MKVNSLAANRLAGFREIAETARLLNEAIFLAAGGLPTTEHKDGLQAVSNEIDNKLRAVVEGLDDLWEDLK